MAKVVFKNVTINPGPAPSESAPAIRDLSLEFPDRAFTTLFGGTDAGQSEILRLIAGLDSPDSGEIAIGDRPVQGDAPHRRDVALVSRDCPLLPHLTIRANLSLPLELRRVTRETIARRIKEIADQLHLESLLDKKPAELGEPDLVRAELGRAFVLQPKVILLDEPFAGLDATSRAHLRAELAAVQQQVRATIIYATVEPSEALTLSDHLVVLRHGSVEQVGAPLSVYNEPANIFVASQLGRPGMNFVRGSIKASGDETLFKESDGGVIELRLGALPAARTCAGRDVLLGIRPEDCSAVPPEHPAGPGIFQTLVDFIDLRGSETLFHAQTGAHALICRAPGMRDPREAGRRIRFRVDATRVHLFDPATTRRIS
jgi:multiple sugar transport system ATP-binding protein